MATNPGDGRGQSQTLGVDSGELTSSELQMLKMMQGSFAVWGVGFEMMRASVEEWTQRRQVHMAEAMAKLNDAVGLETPEQRADAVSQLFVNQIEESIKDFAAAGYKAMAYAGAYGKKLSENRFGMNAPPGMGVPPGMGMGAAPAQDNRPAEPPPAQSADPPGASGSRRTSRRTPPGA